VRALFKLGSNIGKYRYNLSSYSQKMFRNANCTKSYNFMFDRIADVYQLKQLCCFCLIANSTMFKLIEVIAFV